MRVVFFVVGTHGDALPVAALGRGLRERGHDVVVATSHDHRALMEAQGLCWSDLSPSYADEIARSEREPGPALLRARMRDASHHWATQVGRASEGAGLLIGSGLVMAAVASAVGERAGIPVVGAGVMPLTPTRAFPPPVPPPTRTALPGWANLGLAWSVRALVWRVCFADAVQRLRRDLGLGSRGGRPPPMLYNFSPALLPQPADWPRSRIRVTGPWTLPSRSPAPDATLRRFVEEGEMPIAVGFGSMRVSPDERARLSGCVRDAVSRSGRRAVVIRGWGALELGSDERLLVVDHAPFDWLFSRVAAVVHHGGAGTVAMAARAGVPQVIVPFVADQFFWAWQLRRLLVSPGGLSRRTLTGASLADAIASAVAMREAARGLAARMAGEDGVGSAIATLEEWGRL